jgi:hypothetical protein
VSFFRGENRTDTNLRPEERIELTPISVPNFRPRRK